MEMLWHSSMFCVHHNIILISKEGIARNLSIIVRAHALKIGVLIQHQSKHVANQIPHNALYLLTTIWYTREDYYSIYCL